MSRSMNGYVIRYPGGATAAILGDDISLLDMWADRHLNMSIHEAKRNGYTVERIMP